MTIAVYIIFFFVILWLIAMWPGFGRNERMEAFSRQPVAHRGLHDNAGDAPENSLLAIRRAADAGYAIEFDVRMSADEQLVVCHDDNLKRVAGIDRRVSDMTRSELRDVRLFNSDEGVPAFSEVLEAVHGRVPLIVEIKSDNLKEVERLAGDTAFFLDSYDGITCIESFNPAVIRWFRKNRPETLRGQLSERFNPKESGLNIFTGFLFSCCIFNFLTRPDFIAYNVQHRNLFRFRIFRDLFHVCCAAWTVKNEQTLADAARSFDVFIFEGFTPPRRETGSTGKPSAKRERQMRNIVRKHMIVSGTVQAVGFRYRATWIAQALGVTGWVRNRYDDRVEMEVQGTPEEIREMMDRLGKERYIHITDIEEKNTAVIPDEYEFKVRY